jgi:glycosyltransferase involved in cell wall biosynthesis
MLSTYPPTQCGLATFARSLVVQFAEAGAPIGVVRIVDEIEPDVRFVTHQLVISDPAASRAAARALNEFDVAIVQHEYGIFGGRDGADVVDVLARVRVPVIVVLHTVLAEPSAHQHLVLARVVEAATVVVTMTETARTRLIAGWSVDPEKVTVIAHGADDNRTDAAGVAAARRPTILTWGLLGEGKGIEWALEAMVGLADLDPLPLYRVVGETHPRVVEREGEAYRNRLVAQAEALGISSMVEFDGRYLDNPSLQRIVGAADVVLLPYDSRDQVTSGVLTEAVVAGKPVVSTRFPHAVELLATGAGILVPQRDPAAISAALRSVLTEPGLAAHMAATARHLAPGLLWSAVAGEYMDLGRSLLATPKLSVA